MHEDAGIGEDTAADRPECGTRRAASAVTSANPSASDRTKFGAPGFTVYPVTKIWAGGTAEGNGTNTGVPFSSRSSNAQTSGELAPGPGWVPLVLTNCRRDSVRIHGVGAAAAAPSGVTEWIAKVLWARKAARSLPTVAPLGPYNKSLIRMDTRTRSSAKPVTERRRRLPATTARMD